MIDSLLFFIDIFGKPVTINFFGRDRFKSRLGGLCSLFFFGFLGWALYNSSDDLFARKNPSVITSEFYVADSKPISLTAENFAMAIQFTSAIDYLPFINESIYTIEFVYVTFTKITDENGNVQDNVSNFTLRHEICTPNHFGELADSFAKIDLSTTYCLAKEQPELQEIIIQGDPASPLYTLLGINLKQCNNQTSSCAPDDVMSEHLNGAWAYVYYTDTGFVPNNFSRPDSRFRSAYETMISRSTYKEAYVDIARVFVTTDADWLVSAEETKHYNHVNEKYDYLQLEPDIEGNLLTCIFEVSKQELYYSRTYKKIQTVLAEAGGLANVAFSVFIVLVSPYLSLKYRESLINELFDIHPLVPKKKKSNKKRKNKNIRDKGNTNIENKNQDSDKDRETTLGRNEQTEIIKTNYVSTNLKSLFKNETYLTPSLPNEPERTKQDGNFESLQIEKGPFCQSPRLSLLSNRDENNLLPIEKIESGKNPKNIRKERKMHLGDEFWQIYLSQK